MQKQRANTFHKQPPGKNEFRHEMGDGSCHSDEKIDQHVHGMVGRVATEARA
jgi:hypothetical protein